MKKTTSASRLLLDKILVRMNGIEPSRDCSHRLLRPARLPVPPHPQRSRIVPKNTASDKSIALTNESIKHNLLELAPA